MKIWKIEAQGDVVYVEAASEAAAIARLEQMMGAIPRRLLKLSTVDALPEGEELL